jgi:hypothetical protein
VKTDRTYRCTGPLLNALFVRLIAHPAAGELYRSATEGRSDRKVHVRDRTTCPPAPSARGHSRCVPGWVPAAIVPLDGDGRSLPRWEARGLGTADYAALTKLAFLSSFEEELPLLSRRYAEAFGTDRVEGAGFDRFWEIGEVPSRDTTGLSVQWYLMWLPEARVRGPSGSDLVGRGLDEGTLG